MLTTHVLDTALGRPAEGVAVTLFSLAADTRRPVAQAVTNADGRTDEPLTDSLQRGTFELLFAAEEYLRDAHPGGAFYADIPVRFVVGETGHHHVPLLLSPYGYSTYRGS